MFEFKPARDRRLASAMPACPVCETLQPPYGPPRVWHCGVCRCLLIARYHNAPLAQHRRRTRIVAFDHALRNVLYQVVLALVAANLIGIARIAPLAAAFGVCVMVIGATHIIDAVAVVWARKAIARAAARPPRRSAARSAMTLLYGCWVLGSGAVIFHLSLLMIDITDSVVAPPQRHSPGPNTASSTPPSPLYRKPYP
jgi:hypothetical protein